MSPSTIKQCGLCGACCKRRCEPFKDEPDYSGEIHHEEYVLNPLRYRDYFLCKKCEEKGYRTCEKCLQVRNETLFQVIKAEKGWERLQGPWRNAMQLLFDEICRRMGDMEVLKDVISTTAIVAVLLLLVVWLK